MTFTLTEAARLWDDLSVPVDEGLAEVEIHRVERAFGFAFNPDHRVLLSAGLPVGGRWPDWRNLRSVALQEQLAAPSEGVLFDVAENGFWHHSWGSRPSRDAVEAARQCLDRAPRLVPVHGHRYAPALPEPGLPVLSVVQTDVVVYGTDLEDYLRREFGLRTGPITEAKPVPFWSDLA